MVPAGSVELPICAKLAIPHMVTSTVISGSPPTDSGIILAWSEGQQILTGWAGKIGVIDESRNRSASFTGLNASCIHHYHHKLVHPAGIEPAILYVRSVE